MSNAVEAHEKPAAAKAKATPTKYLVLAFLNDFWRECATVEAQSADAAIRLAVPSLPKDTRAEKFVAVPARSWKPRSITIETQPRVKLS